MAQVSLYVRQAGTARLRGVTESADQLLASQIEGTLATRSLHADAAATAVNLATGVNVSTVSLGAAGSTVTIPGNLTVSGTTTTLNTTNLAVADTVIILASGAAVGDEAGVAFERGATGDDAMLLWNEAGSRFELGFFDTVGGTVAPVGALASLAGLAMGPMVTDTVTLNTANPDVVLSRSAANTLLIDDGAGGSGGLVIGGGTSAHVFAIGWHLQLSLGTEKIRDIMSGVTPGRFYASDMGIQWSATTSSAVATGDIGIRRHSPGSFKVYDPSATTDANILFYDQTGVFFARFGDTGSGTALVAGGASRGVALRANNNNAAYSFNLNSTGQITPGQDNTQDFGSAALGFKSGYFGTSVILGTSEDVALERLSTGILKVYDPTATLSAAINLYSAAGAHTGLAYDASYGGLRLTATAGSVGIAFQTGVNTTARVYHAGAGTLFFYDPTNSADMELQLADDTGAKLVKLANADGTLNLSAGSSRGVQINPAGVIGGNQSWQFTSAGNLEPSANVNALSIGSATREIHTIYVGTAIQLGTAQEAVLTPSGAGVMHMIDGAGGADAEIHLSNAAGTNVVELKNFGGQARINATGAAGFEIGGALQAYVQSGNWNGTGSLGSSSVTWANLYLASTGKIYWSSGGVKASIDWLGGLDSTIVFDDPGRTYDAALRLKNIAGTGWGQLNASATAGVVTVGDGTTAGAIHLLSAAGARTTSLEESGTARGLRIGDATNYSQVTAAGSWGYLNTAGTVAGWLFQAGGATGAIVASDGLHPGSASGNDLGRTSLEWANLYIATSVQLGAAQEAVLTGPSAGVLAIGDGSTSGALKILDAGGNADIHIWESASSCIIDGAAGGRLAAGTTNQIGWDFTAFFPITTDTYDLGKTGARYDQAYLLGVQLGAAQETVLAGTVAGILSIGDGSTRGGIYLLDSGGVADCKLVEAGGQLNLDGLLGVVLGTAGTAGYVANATEFRPSLADGTLHLGLATRAFGTTFTKEIQLGTSQSGVITEDSLQLLERSSNPSAPAEGKWVMWMSDGTGHGDDGDVLIASTAGATTNYAIVFDHSAGAAF
jgi:hypothetical protein